MPYWSPNIRGAGGRVARRLERLKSDLLDLGPNHYYNKSVWVRRTAPNLDVYDER